jgi:hypothetical protein
MSDNSPAFRRWARAGLGSARVSRAGFGVAPKRSFLRILIEALNIDPKAKFATARTRAPARGTRALPEESADHPALPSLLWPCEIFPAFGAPGGGCCGMQIRRLSGLGRVTLDPRNVRRIGGARKARRQVSTRGGPAELNLTHGAQDDRGKVSALD